MYVPTLWLAEAISDPMPMPQGSLFIMPVAASQGPCQSLGTCPVYGVYWFLSQKRFHSVTAFQIFSDAHQETDAPDKSMLHRLLGTSEPRYGDVLGTCTETGPPGLWLYAGISLYVRPGPSRRSAP